VKHTSLCIDRKKAKQTLVRSLETSLFCCYVYSVPLVKLKELIICHEVGENRNLCMF